LFAEEVIMQWNSVPVVVSPKAIVETSYAPINPAWILDGSPRARAATLSRSPDGTAVTVAWECTAGTFRWRFIDDETVHIVDGGVTVHWNGDVHHLGPGDVAYFPAGTVATWIVQDYVSKIAFIRVPPPVAVSVVLKVWRRLLRVVVGTRESPAQGMEPRSA
jgi:uncharacterized cupin superfamily protein